MHERSSRQTGPTSDPRPLSLLGNLVSWRVRRLNTDEALTGMTRDPIGRRRKTRVLFAVLAVGIVVSVLVALGLVYLGQAQPRF